MEQFNDREFDVYRGNPLLKNKGVQIEWTPKLVEEYLKCSEDPIYFTETYMQIINVDKGLMPFRMYDYQKDMLRTMADNRRVAICTARQIGKSTVTCAYILWYIIFHADKTVGILANKGETAREILGKVQLAYQYLPKFLQQGVVEWNKGSMVLENNSRVIAAATSGTAVRGYSFSLLFIDECAFVENWEEFSMSVLPTVSSGETTKIILVSTPNGLNHFYKIFTEGEEKRNGYATVRITWDKVPGRTEAWRIETLQTLNNDLSKFAQEYGADFQGSSSLLISASKLANLVYLDPIEKTFEGLKTFIMPLRGHTYTMTCDVSRGKGFDYSAFSVFDITTMPYRQVCTFRSNIILPTEYADIIFRTAKFYNDATILVELNDIGGQVADLLFDEYEYEGILFTESAGRAGKRISTVGARNADRGLRQTQPTRNTGCSIMKILIEQDQLLLSDWEYIEELSHFSRKNNKYEAEPGYHDDTVLVLIMFSWLTDQQFFKDVTDINTLKRIRDRSAEEMDINMPLGWINTGHQEDEYTITDMNGQLDLWVEEAHSYFA